MSLDALDRNARLRGNRGNTPGIGKKSGEQLVHPQLVDRRIAHAAGYRRLRAGRRNEDHVAGLQLHVLRLITVNQQIV